VSVRYLTSFALSIVLHCVCLYVGNNQLITNPVFGVALSNPSTEVELVAEQPQKKLKFRFLQHLPM